MKTIVQITLAFALLFACAQQTTAQQLKGMSLDEIQKQFSSPLPRESLRVVKRINQV